MLTESGDKLIVEQRRKPDPPLPENVEELYEYDYENRLVKLTKKVNDTEQEYRYGYDYRTRRIFRNEGNGDETISFSGGTSVSEWGSAGSSPLVEYIRGSDYGGGIGGILYSFRNNVPSFTHYDARGDVTQKVDTNGDVTYQAQYEAFGTRTKETGNTQDRQKANTKDEDPTGLLNEGFRYRDLRHGVFTTKDPAGFIDGPNLYTYVRQNPWSKFDPQGLQAEFIEDRSPTNVKEFQAEYQSYSKKIDQWETAKAEYNSAQSSLADYKNSHSYFAQSSAAIWRLNRNVELAQYNLSLNFGENFQDDLYYANARMQHYLSTADAEGNVSKGRESFQVLDRYVMGRGYNTSPAIDPIDLLVGGMAGKTAAGTLGRWFTKNPTPLVEQYALRAGESGFYPVMKRGFASAQKEIWLETHDVWKYGTTKNPTTRYTQKFLDEMGLRYEMQMKGTLQEALSSERRQILRYLEERGMLPPGNKIIK